jgi:hypothetical protein
MSDLHADLDREARRVSAEYDALTEVRERAGRNRLVRRVATGALALVIGGAGLGLAYAAFRSPSAGRPAAGPTSSPTPGPTPTSDDATPPPVRIVIEDRTGLSKTLPYAFAWIEARGRGAHHGGYDVGDAHHSGFDSVGQPVAPTLTGEPIPITTIYCDLQYEAEALRMRELLFPGAHIARERPDEGVRVAYDPEPLLTVALGQDFATLHSQAIDAFEFVSEFGLSRAARSERAFTFVTGEVHRAYEDGEVGLSMYGYAEHRPFEVGLVIRATERFDPELPKEFYLTFYSDPGDQSYTERVRVDEVVGELKVVEALVSSVSEG